MNRVSVPKKPWLQYLYLLRYQLGMLLLLIFLPALSAGPLKLYLGNLYDLDKWDMFFVTYTLLLLLWTNMATTKLIGWYAHLRCSDLPVKRPKLISVLTGPRASFFFPLAAIPTIILFSMHAAPQGMLMDALLMTLLAVIAGIASLVIITWPQELYRRYFPVREDLKHHRLFVMLNQLWQVTVPDQEREEEEAADSDRAETPADYPGWKSGTGVFSGYFDKGHLFPGHSEAMLMTLMTLIIYIVIGFYFEPEYRANRYQFPALGFLHLLMMLISWVMPSVAFFFDRWRVPVLPLLIILSLVMYQLVGIDHLFEMKKVKEVKPLTVMAAYEAWRNPPYMKGKTRRPRPIVIVNCSGGGMTAACWAFEVMAGLEMEMQEDFTESVAMVSGVSGGSVGSMYYLQNYISGKARDEAALQKIRTELYRSSLSSAGWGMAYPDFWRFAFPPAGKFFSHRDRSWAIESSWRVRMEGLEDSKFQTLLGYRPLVSSGVKPPFFFNATVVETGDQLLFTPLDLPAKAPAFDGVKTADSLFGDPRDAYKLDMAMVTAARLSATFPFVTPVARPVVKGDEMYQSVHVADGGYYDNMGVASSLRWLDYVLTRLSEEGKPMPHVLIVEIDAFGLELNSDESEPIAPANGWVSAFAGPMLTLLNVRNSSQAVRNHFEIELMQHHWGKMTKIEKVRFVTPRKIQMTFPMSWKLSPSEQKAIHDSWQDQLDRKDEPGSPIKVTRDFVARAMTGKSNNSDKSGRSSATLSAKQTEGVPLAQ